MFSFFMGMRNRGNDVLFLGASQEKISTWLLASQRDALNRDGRHGFVDNFYLCDEFEILLGRDGL